MTIIAGHIAPDWDCITPLWLLKRFDPICSDAEIVLVRAGQDSPKGCYATVDTGGGFLDHHHLSGKESQSTCAALLTANWLKKRDLLNTNKFDSLLALIYAGDIGHPSANVSKRSGMHALLRQWQRAGMDDMEQIQQGFWVLNVIAAYLEFQNVSLEQAIQCAIEPFARYIAAYQAFYAETQAKYDTVLRYRSADGLVVGLEGGSSETTFLAYEHGARLVVWHSPSPTTVAVGINRHSESGLHCGTLVDRIQRMNIDTALGDELAKWYRHPVGFFSGRGTAKSPDPTPLVVSLELLAQWFDSAWER